MIIKANKQIGFIYKNNESIDKILKDGDVVFERGFLRERTSTTLPITFGGVGKDLKDYRVYGNTVQNSTSGKNICLQANIVDTNTIRFDINSNEINRMFTLSLIPPLSVNSMSIVAFADGVNLRSVGTINLISGERSTTTITLTESIYNTIQNASEVHFNLYKSGAGISTTSIIEEPQIENNSSFTSYEPYTGGQPSPNPDYPQEIISCGDRTKNLFLTPDTPSQLNLPTYSKNNKNSFTLYYNQTTTSVKSPYVRIDFDITQFKPNTRYTISKKYTVSGDNFRNVGAIRSYINGSNGSVVNSDTFSFTTPNEISSLGVYFYLGYENRTEGESQITFYDIQLEENSTATPYEPYGYKIPVNVNNVITNIYLDEPLRKIDGYSDYIDFINGKIVRKFGKNMPNINDITLRSTYTNIEYAQFPKALDFEGYNKYGNYPMFCSHAIYSANPSNWDSNVNVNKLYTGATATQWWIGFKKGTELDTIKQKLEGCSIVYRLATPTEESITLPNIPTVEGNNTLNIETELTPSQVYIKYKSNE